MLELLSYTKLRDLDIVQNTYTTENSKTCSSNAWMTYKQRNPRLRVHLYIRSNKDQHLVWQDSAPVHTVVFDSPKIKVIFTLHTNCPTNQIDDQFYIYTYFTSIQIWFTLDINFQSISDFTQFVLKSDCYLISKSNQMKNWWWIDFTLVSHCRQLFVKRHKIPQSWIWCQLWIKSLSIIDGCNLV